MLFGQIYIIYYNNLLEMEIRVRSRVKSLEVDIAKYSCCEMDFKDSLAFILGLSWHGEIISGFYPPVNLRT